MNEWSKEQYLTFLTENLTGLVYFYTPMCGTCQLASKMLRVISEMKPDLEIGKMDLNYTPELAQSLSVESVPCLLFIKGGEIIEMIYAFHSVPFLLDKINTNLN
ncbi:thioredoxin family protein [Neobacillus sp. PS3-34]|uniref:thioredoxin family protein n=1 Tax=Neobacillus sp. PS3-34 TaxID=3070678 RepID=UPI0027E0BD3E|nr:thioredoxin family protein [Neobacillus sp. PS3-34]WML47048.1 thioredoxin family protein [Neobacillus sp. PS3-34]